MLASVAVAPTAAVTALNLDIVLPILLLALTRPRNSLNVAKAAPITSLSTMKGSREKRAFT
jgi:hypothetical protein